jgi:peptidoglycan hydrolase-like protein with peptidoglycan-binding domain
MSPSAPAEAITPVGPVSPTARPFSAAEAAVANAMAVAGERPTAAPTNAPLFMAASPPLSPATVPVTLRALRAGSQGDLVRAWQSFLLGQGFDPGGLDGVFGDKTVAATEAFQQRNGVTADGIAGRETIMRAMELGFELIEEPALDTSGSNFPPRPDFPPLESTAARQAVFGRFDFVPDPRPDNREHIRILGTWERDNIVNVPIPQLRAALGPRAPTGMRFHRLAAEQLKELWADWERANLLDRILTFDGAFVPRFIRGSTTVLSNHAFGSAFDINADENPLGARPALVGQRGATRELVPLANKSGFFWGGHFGSRQDGMHFEIAFLK